MKINRLKFTTAFLTAVILSVTVFAQTATRITFARGRSSATLSGSVSGGGGQKEYVLRGKKGQTLWANVTSSCEGVMIEVLDGGNGQSFGDASTEFRDELPGTDDFIIRVQNSDEGLCKFSLKVGIE
ncbi:MAG TPA: hypothetical protein PKY59_06550 [Pyrinomonadaceae bacterium]|nr:hypothetical protein [Pyrinomonadaceae bacterium]